ncbi:hypothetical protein F4819DRAFT_485773 [Hypoxylon fuscum]|nr:hypothetical protein F4819DRAFT_485773 [Hypoxylon fuscum]
MKATAIIIAMAAVPAAVADFWLSYLQRIDDMGRAVDSQSGGTFVKDPQINCDDDVLGLKIWQNVGDASADHPGMRTVPGDNVGPPFYRDPLDIVEFNTLSDKPGHQTIYKNRGYAMVAVDGTKTGQCYLNRTFLYDLDCTTQNERVYLSGSSMFFCESEIEL